jgi:micrococcal nuclease
MKAIHLKRFLTALAATYLLACSASVYSAEITYFYDGDTVKINDSGREYKLRLSDIDAPERNQDYGKKARRALMQFCKNAAIEVQLSGVDKYHRNLGKLNCNKQDASLYMVKNGHAWFYQHYSNDSELALAEQAARDQQLGLWASKNPIQPWTWRKYHTH